MVYRPLGATGLTVSVLGFGAMRLPEGFDEAVEVMRHAFAQGVNFLDTAPAYGDSHKKCAAALKGWRDKVTVSTKNPCWGEEPVAGWRKRLEEHLEQLQVDSVGVYEIWHSITWKAFEEHVAPKGKILDLAKKAKDEGLIRHLSFSFHDTPEALVKLVETGEFECMICQYNLLDRANEEGMAKAAERGMGVIVMGPVGGGRLAGLSPELAKMASGPVASTPELALRFVLANPAVSTAISGMSTKQMVDENVATASREDAMSPDELDRLKGALDEAQKFAKLYCTGCGYCMPCPHGVDIPGNFALMNYHRVYGLTEHARAHYAKRPKEREEGDEKARLYAGACVECGECEPKCPQKIPIIAQLKETHETLGG